MLHIASRAVNPDMSSRKYEILFFEHLYFFTLCPVIFTEFLHELFIHLPFLMLANKPLLSRTQTGFIEEQESRVIEIIFIFVTPRKSCCFVITLIRLEEMVESSQRFCGISISCIQLSRKNFSTL